MLTAEKVRASLTPDDIERLFVEALHADPPARDQRGNLLFSTEICHGGDSPHKLVYRLDVHNFYCWTHCHRIDLFEIVRRRLGLSSFKEAFDFVTSFFGLTDSDAEAPRPRRITDDWDLLESLENFDKPERPEDGYVERILPEGLLSVFSPPCGPKEWVDDGISPEVMAHYGIRVDSANHRIIIPHRNADGQLIGIRARAYDPFELQYAKYSPVSIDGKMYNFPTGRYLFGLYQNKDTIRRMRRVLICEGEKSVLQSATFYGVDDSYCVATCGSTITDEQADLLLDLGVEDVILGYDRDFMGRKGDEDVAEYERKLYRVIQPLLPYFNVYVIFDYDHMTGYKDSPTDCGRRIFEDLWKKKIYVPPVGGAQAKANSRKGGK